MSRLTVILLFFAIPSFSQSTITLRRTFIDSFKDKLTISAEYDVWYAHHKANAPENDGDIHVSGYDKKIGMPVVAEVMNAAAEEEAMHTLINAEGHGAPGNPKISITGVWRLWPEHMGTKGSLFHQGMKLTRHEIDKKTTNPDHVFEIHPLTRVGAIDLKRSFCDIDGYYPWNVAYVFDKLKNKTCQISSNKKTVSIDLKQAAYNYVDAWVRIDSLWQVNDGAFAYCTILDFEFTPGDNVPAHTVAYNTRIGFVKGTVPYNEARLNGTGAFLHILGTTRINLAVISAREAAAKEHPEALNRQMPIELVAVGMMK